MFQVLGPMSPVGTPSDSWLLLARNETVYVGEFELKRRRLPEISGQIRYPITYHRGPDRVRSSRCSLLTFLTAATNCAAPSATANCIVSRSAVPLIASSVARRRPSPSKISVLLHSRPSL